MLPIRRAQLVAPFGVGAMATSRDGTSMICSGLDYWFQRPEDDIDNQYFDINEFIIDEWRLQRQLSVNHFRLPPDYRKSYKNQKITNSWLTIPFFRFPRWHYCKTCGFLIQLSPYTVGRPWCPECKAKKKNRELVPVPIVAMCEQGHLQDFPWREWVHRSSNTTCTEKLRLKSTGGATLSALRVECECGVPARDLGSVTISEPVSKGGATFLTSTLDESGLHFLCQGQKPWFGDYAEPCDRPLRATHRSASNVYFARVHSSIFIPRNSSKNINSELLSRLENPPISTFIQLLKDLGQNISPDLLRDQQRLLLEEFNDNEISEALKLILGDDCGGEPKETQSIDESPQVAFKREEYNIIRTKQETDRLRTRPVNMEKYEDKIRHFFSRIVLIEKLRETRALTGFTRVVAENDQDVKDLKLQLWLNTPKFSESWLPAYVVHGEGIYLEFNEQLLRHWEQMHRDDLSKRLDPLINRHQEIQTERNVTPRALSARFIMVHTFAHLIMNRLVFECGYSSASLRERLYVSDSVKAPMAAVLIYTAAGDSEGTMGGLVRMGTPRYLEPIIYRAVESARWCGSDPICMEMADHGGQGPDSCNLAACHNCCLVPETACEEFNRFLDRGLITGSLSNRLLGFFND